MTLEQIPQTIYNQLVESINVYMNSDSIPTEFELRSLKRQIEKLKKVDPIEGWLTAAMLSAWQWDTESTSYNANAAVSLAPRDHAVLEVASRCLWNAGLYDESSRLIGIAESISPNSVSIVDANIERNIAFGKLNKAAELVRDAITKGVKPRTSLDYLQKNLRNLEESEISEHRVQIEAGFVMEVMAENHARINNVKFIPWTDPETQKKCLSVSYGFHGTISQELSLEKALVSRLICDPEWDPDLLSTEFEAEPFPQ